VDAITQFRGLSSDIFIGRKNVRSDYLVHNERTAWNEISRAQRVRFDHAVLRRQVDNIFSCYRCRIKRNDARTQRRASGSPHWHIHA